jgi:hypothetical protein
MHSMASSHDPRPLPPGCHSNSHTIYEPVITHVIGSGYLVGPDRNRPVHGHGLPETGHERPATAAKLPGPVAPVVSDPAAIVINISGIVFPL